MRKLQLFLLTLAGFALVALPNLATAGIIISEYVEGSSFNKAIEIFNSTNATEDMSQYSLYVYFNGSAVPTPAGGIPLSAVLVAPGDVFVIAHTSAGAAIVAVADQLDGGINFNGNDAVHLVRNSTGGTVDSVGQIGFDPGTEWGTGLVSTADNTLRRQMQVCIGDYQVYDPFDPSLQWLGFATDTFDGLGTHVHDCFAIPDEAHTWGAVKGLYK